MHGESTRIDRLHEVVLQQNRILRELLGAIDAAASRTRGTPESASALELREAILRLVPALERRCGCAEQDLVPLVDKIDAWGEIRAAVFEREVREERTMLALLVDEVARGGVSLDAIARDARHLVDGLLLDLARDEREIEEVERIVLGATDQETG
jgi:hypothetical protein